MDERDWLAEQDAPQPPCKLDLRYFTEKDRCPLMVRRGARRAFELFLYLAHGFLKSRGQALTPSHEALCRACGLKPQDRASGPAISRLLRQLRDTYGVIDYEPVRNRRPQIVLRPPGPLPDPWNPPHYIYFRHGWGAQDRTTFQTLGRRAFAAEYMYFLSEYEASLARRKHDRAYWFFPLDRIAATFHMSTQFAAVGLRALVDLGVMRVRYGQYQAGPATNDVARANRFYFVGLAGLGRRTQELELVEAEYEAEFPVACKLAGELSNGLTVKNVRGLCQLLAAYGAPVVTHAVTALTQYQRCNPRRHLAYLEAVLRPRGAE